jgi:uncharacterized protein YcbK (DUF882 family)
MSYACKHFALEELVPPGHLDWDLLHPELLELLDEIRDLLDEPMIVNNWKHGGNHSLRGWRPEDCTTGAKNSYHKKGMATDFDVPGSTAEEVRKKLIQWKTKDGKLALLGGIETGVSWIHIDTRNDGLSLTQFHA